MGFIKEAKAQAVAQDARKAWEAGRSVFTPILNVPATHPGMSGAVDDIALMVEAITGVGWRLHTWAVASDAKGRPQAMPLFMR